MQPPALQIKHKNCSSKSLHQVRKQKEKNVWTREEMLGLNSISQVGKNLDCCTEMFTFFFQMVFPTQHTAEKTDTQYSYFSEAPGEKTSRRVKYCIRTLISPILQVY